MATSSAREAGRLQTFRQFREAGILVFLVLVIIITALISPRFLLPSNLRNILLDTPLLLVVAMGMTMVVISRNIDLSVGSILAVSGMVVGKLFKSSPELPLLFAACVGIGVGAFLGSINGMLVSLIRIPAIITTLATLSIYRGVVFVISDGKQIDPDAIPPSLIRLSQSSVLGLPPLVLIALAIVVCCHLFLRYGKTGRHIYSVGGNPTAAHLCGIPVTAITFLVFVLTGALSGLAGVMYASRYGFLNPGQTGSGFELSVIAATIIGGTNVFGGAGSVSGTVLGCLLLSVLGNALTVTGLSATWQLAVYGVIILAAVLADALLREGNQP